MQDVALDRVFLFRIEVVFDLHQRVLFLGILQEPFKCGANLGLYDLLHFHAEYLIFDSGSPAFE